MNKPTLAALALSLLAVGHAASADPHTPGYDRPAPEQKQTDGHAHVVYWSTYFENFANDPQTMADTYDVGDLRLIGQKLPHIVRPAPSAQPPRK